MDFFKKIAIGVIVGLILMLSRKYLFLNVRAAELVSNPNYINYYDTNFNQYGLCSNGCSTRTFVYSNNQYWGLQSAGSDEYWKSLYYSYNDKNFPTGFYDIQFNIRMNIGLRNADGVNVSLLDSDGHTFYCYTNGSGMNYLYENSLVISNGDTFYSGNGIMGVYCPNVELNSNKNYAIVVDGYFHLVNGSSFGISRLTFVNTNGAISSAINSVNDSVDDIRDKDISNSAKESVDDTDLNDYVDTESDLFGATDSNYTVEDTLDVGLDSNGSLFLWNTITSFIQTNSKVFGVVISMLSLGIIKLALGR